MSQARVIHGVKQNMTKICVFSVIKFDLKFSILKPSDCLQYITNMRLNIRNDFFHD